MKRKHQLVRNFIYAFFAQGVVLLLNTLVSLFLPKVISISDFSYWQLFIFYAGYVGITHLGISDGVYLLNGGKEYSQLNKKAISTNFWTLVLQQIAFSVLLSLVAIFLIKDPDRRFVIYITVIYMICGNITWFIGYVFQSVNMIKRYSLGVVISKASFIIALLICIFAKVVSFRTYIIYYSICQLFAAIYSMIRLREIIFTKPDLSYAGLGSTYKVAKVGIFLTIANVSSTFIVGAGRQVVDMMGGINDFGKISLATGITSFFLLFINQVGLVLFPALRRLDEKQLKNVFDKTRMGLGYILPVILVAYIPVKLLLTVWLPKYEVSFVYLAYLLPICMFDGKMNLLFATYLKVLRKERVLLVINIATMLMSGLLSFIGYVLTKDITAVAICITLAIVMRSIVSEVLISKAVESKPNGVIIYEIGLVLVFWILIKFLSGWMAFAVYALIYVIYLLLNQKKIRALYDYLNSSWNGNDIAKGAK
jgi:O-antigen/teichoic acid export membrane protein